MEDNFGKIGTPHWMAPEILRGEEYREASDVWSFGVIVWEMCTNEIPFDGRSIAQITGGVGYHQETLQVNKQTYKVLAILIRNCL